MPGWLELLWNSAPFWRAVSLVGLLAGLGTILRLIYLTRELSEVAGKDPLTGIANRRRFEEHLAERIQLARRQTKPITLLLVDLDYLKVINDTQGHPRGDHVLIALAGVLAQSVSRETDLAARLGGDEFAVTLYDCSPEGAELVANKILVAVRNLPTHEGRTLTVSIGALTYHQGPVSSGAKELVDSADRALYLAKQARDTAYYVTEGTPRGEERL